MLQGERVTLRPVERADLPRLWELMEDIEVAVLAGGGPIVPTSLSEYEARFDKELTERRADRINFAVDVEGVLIGMCQLHAIDHYHRRRDLGIAIGRDYWAKGLGQDAVKTSSRTRSRTSIFDGSVCRCSPTTPVPSAPTGLLASLKRDGCGRIRWSKGRFEMSWSWPSTATVAPMCPAQQLMAHRLESGSGLCKDGGLRSTEPT